MKNFDLSKMVRQILTEEVEQKKSSLRVPEVADGEDLKKITPHEQDSKTKDQLLDDMCKLVTDIDKSYVAEWDDHGDLSIKAKDLFTIRIVPNWENNYKIEAFIRNQDRLLIIGQTWEQVKQFVKNNLKDSTSSVEKAYNKSIENREDRSKSDKELPKGEKVKTLPLTNEKPKDTKNKDKNYTEKEVKSEDDLPNKPMKEMGEVKKLSDYKVKDPVKLRKKTPDTKLVVKKQS